MSLHSLGRTGKSFPGSASSSGARYRMFPRNVDVQEAWVMLTNSEYSRERQKSARQAVPSPWISTFGYSCHMNKFQTVSRRLKPTAFKSPWMTLLSWTTNEESCITARDIETDLRYCKPAAISLSCDRHQFLIDCPPREGHWQFGIVRQEGVLHHHASSRFQGFHSLPKGWLRPWTGQNQTCNQAQARYSDA
jgi:hypothetical protein